MAFADLFYVSNLFSIFFCYIVVVIAFATVAMSRSRSRSRSSVRSRPSFGLVSIFWILAVLLLSKACNSAHGPAKYREQA